MAKYEVKIYEDGRVIDHASISKNTAILIQNLLSKRSKIKKLFDSIYLWCSDCDGMCSHCDEDLKRKCYQRKNEIKADSF